MKVQERGHVHMDAGTVQDSERDEHQPQVHENFFCDPVEKSINARIKMSLVTTKCAVTSHNLLSREVC